MKLWIRLTTIAALTALGLGAFAHAEDTASSETPATPTEWQANHPSAGNRPGGATSLLREGPTGGLWQRSQLLGDPFGVRSWLARYGASLSIQETSEFLGNTQGGVQQGFLYDGLTTIDLQINTKRAFDLYGGTINVSALEVHGHNLSARNLDTLQTASGIEADNGFRLWELWYQQMFLFNQIDFKVGAQSLDQEFMVSQYASLFANTMFGWPMLTSADLLGGGPAYPLASLGLRFRAQPSGEPWAFLVGVYDDNPSGLDPQHPQDSQSLNARGTNFRLQDKPLVIGEIQYSQPAVGQLEYADHRPVLPGTYKLGFWYDFGHFADQRFSTDGLSLANGSSNFTPALHDGNYSVYVVADQLLWRRSPESAEGVGAFLRAMAAPGTQNLISFSLNSGVTWHAPIRHREYDSMGLGLGVAQVSGSVSALDRDAADFANSPLPVRNSETFLEFTYQYQVVPWWQLQPDIQYVFNPGAGIANPSNPTQSIPNELVVGLRTNISL